MIICPPRLRIKLVNPHWRQIDKPDGVLLTTNRGELAVAKDSLGAVNDGIAVHLIGTQDTPRSVQFFRSITTSDQLYWSIRSGLLLVSDHFRSIVEDIPVVERQLDTGAIIDHALFRTVPGECTYLTGVHRLGAGARLIWYPNAPLRLDVIQRLDRPRAYITPAEAVNQIESALLRSCEPPVGTLGNLLSGGVDSTLLQSMVGRTAIPVSATIDSPEFAFEEQYAQAASRLFGAEHRLVRLHEREYAEQLTRLIARVGLPPHHLQTVLVDSALGTGPLTFLCAQFADALFGLDVSLRVCRILRLGLQRWGRTIGRVRQVPWPRLQGWFEQLRYDLAQLTRPLGDCDGLGARCATYSDIAALRQLFGTQQIDERLRRRLDYVRQRATPVDRTDPPLLQHLELAHWVDFFCDDTVSIWRQCAHSRGVALQAPFSDPLVVAAALSVSSQDRFCSGPTKPLLKELLKRRVPAYPATQPKGGSGLPLARYLRTGPLCDLADDARRAQWPLPLKELPGPVADWLIWNQLTLRLWDEQVRLARLEATSAKIELELDSHATPTA